MVEHPDRKTALMLVVSILGIIIAYGIAAWGDPAEVPGRFRRLAATLSACIAIALSCVAARRQKTPPITPQPDHSPLSARTTTILLILILLTAGIFRFFRLAETPPGLWYDEANHGLDALLILEYHETPVLFPSNCGQEPIFKYLVALSIMFSGNGIEAVRHVSAFTGLITVFLLFVWFRSLAGPRLALFTTALASTSFWHVHFSRIGFRGILVPFFLTAFLYVARHREIPLNLYSFPALIAGFLMGFGLYSYVAFRLVPVLFIFNAILAYFLSPSESRRDLVFHPLFWLGFILAAAPLAATIYANPNLFLARIKLTSVFSEPGNVYRHILHNIYKHILVPVLGGDPIVRHGIPGKPPLSIIEAVLFGIGLGAAMGTFRRHESHTGLLFYFGMLIPGILSVSVQAPATLRTLGAVPAIFLLILKGWKTLETAFPRLMRQPLWIILIPFAALCLNGYAYSHSWRSLILRLPAASRSEFGFCREETALASHLIKSETGNDDIVLSPQLYFHPTIRFLTWGKTTYRGIYRPEYLAYDRTSNRYIRVYLNTTPRNLWWLRSSEFKNFFYFWLRTTGLTPGETEAMVSYCYPRTGFLMHTSDAYLLDHLQDLYPDGKTSHTGGATVFTLPPLDPKETNLPEK